MHIVFSEHNYKTGNIPKLRAKVLKVPPNFTNMSTLYSEDVCAFKNDPAIIGTIEYTWSEVDIDPSLASPIVTSIRIYPQG